MADKIPECTEIIGQCGLGKHSYLCPLSKGDQIVYTARPRPRAMSVGELIQKLQAMDKDLPVYVDTEARCDQYHMYPTSDVYDTSDERTGMEKQAIIFLHI